MNLLPDGTGWILPPRCAARYTMQIMWKYGVTNFSYHDMDPECDVSRIIMNVRNPYTRLRSWLRLWNTTIEEPIDAREYILNLHYQESSGVQFVNKIENPNKRDLPWKYIVPMTAYLNSLHNFNKHPDIFLHQENLEADMKKAGYENLDPNDPNNWEPGDDSTDHDFYANNPDCAEIVRTYYLPDFENFGYSLDPEEMSLYSSSMLKR